MPASFASLRNVRAPHWAQHGNRRAPPRARSIVARRGCHAFGMWACPFGTLASLCRPPCRGAGTFSSRPDVRPFGRAFGAAGTTLRVVRHLLWAQSRAVLVPCCAAGVRSPTARRPQPLPLRGKHRPMAVRPGTRACRRHGGLQRVALTMLCWWRHRMRSAVLFGTLGRNAPERAPAPARRLAMSNARRASRAARNGGGSDQVCRHVIAPRYRQVQCLMPNAVHCGFV